MLIQAIVEIFVWISAFTIIIYDENLLVGSVIVAGAIQILVSILFDIQIRKLVLTKKVEIFKQRRFIDRHDLLIGLIVLAVILLFMFSETKSETSISSNSIWFIGFYIPQFIKLLTLSKRVSYFIENGKLHHAYIFDKPVLLDKIDLVFINSKADFSVVSGEESKVLGGDTNFLRSLMKRLIEINPDIKTEVNSNQIGAIA